MKKANLNIDQRLALAFLKVKFEGRDLEQPWELTTERLIEILAEFTSMKDTIDPEREHVNITAILYEVSSKTGFTIEELQSRTRNRDIVDARFVYFRRAKEKTKSTFKAIGYLVGKDHASVMHGIREAYENNAVVKLYERCYGKTAVESKALDNPQADNKADGGPEEGSVLSYFEMAKGEQALSVRKSVMPEMRKGGVYSAVGSY